MSTVTPGGRRERVRAATVAGDQGHRAQAARRRGAAEPSTLRAIAREMGMTAPGLYRYFPSHEDLWEELCHDTYDEIADAVEAATGDPTPRDAGRARLVTAARRPSGPGRWSIRGSSGWSSARRCPGWSGRRRT